eukprot:6399556-Alexandrium_andersonii.AAC.1
MTGRGWGCTRGARWLRGVSAPAGPVQFEPSSPGGPPAAARGQGPSGSGVPDEEPLPAHEAGLFRAGAARANYLAPDRPDVAFPAKELCRRMSAPR